MTSQWLTVSDIAALLKVSASNVYKLVESGALVAHRIGCGRGAIRVSQENFDRFIEDAQAPVSNSAAPKRGGSVPAAQVAFKHLNVSRVLASKTPPRSR